MRKWLFSTAIALIGVAAILTAAGWAVAQRWQPWVREQVVRYLEDRFGTGVELSSLRVSVTVASLTQWRTAVLRISGNGLRLPSPGAESLPPLLTAEKFRLEAELGALWKSPRRVRSVSIEQADINIPSNRLHAGPPAPQTSSPAATAVTVDLIDIKSMNLRLFPSDPAKVPRLYEIHSLVLHGAGPGSPFQYRANLTNPKPPGVINVSGRFGPWQKDDPGLTPVSGSYTFENADLAVFRSIAGTLASTGRLQGVLRRIEVDGETRTPQFRLAGGNPIPLTTHFHSIVDGTSGNTFLQPVRATLGSSVLIAKGEVVRPRGAQARRVALDVVMSKGRIEDLLRLAVKAREPLLLGAIDLRTRMEIVPTSGPFNERLLLDGDFDLEESRFTAGSVQRKIDELSRRAQGRPKDEEISDVLSSMRGGFTMRDGEIRFSALTFRTPGAAIHLKGSYGLYSENIDLHGVARLQAKASQTMTGWKRLALKPVDPFLSRAGAGALLPIKITGTRSQPQFGLDRGKHEDSADRRAPAGAN